MVGSLAVRRRILDKPHYVFRPGQVLRRVRIAGRTWSKHETAVSTLPWGAQIECWPADTIGASIVRTGLYDLLATEALFRAADPGDVALDVGANVGHMTSALATAVGPTGRVVSFEPQPAVLAVLERNARRWREDAAMARIETRGVGVSNRRGTATLVTAPDFEDNRGTSRVVLDHETVIGDRTTEIELVRLDDVVAEPVGVLKLDVEGHERAALEGARGLLRSGAVRDVVFEETAPYPTEVTRLLEDHGFKLAELRQHLHRPRLVAPGAVGDRGSWDPAVFLATIQPERLQARFQGLGWQALRRRPSRNG